MKPENRLRRALIELYWKAHSDGRLCEIDDALMDHLKGAGWARRRKNVIEDAMRQSGLLERRKS